MTILVSMKVSVTISISLKVSVSRKVSVSMKVSISNGCRVLYTQNVKRLLDDNYYVLHTR